MIELKIDSQNPEVFIMFSKKKNFSLISFAILTLSNAISIHSYAADKSPKLKIGVVDVQAAILQTDEGKAEKAVMEKDFEEKRKNILAQQNDLKKLEEEFQAQQSILSDSDKQAKQKEFQAKLQKMQSSQISFEQEIRQKELKASQQIFQNMIGIIREISEPEDYDAVFDRGAGVVLYAKNAVDLTPKVVASYNKKFKVKAKAKGTN